MAFEDRKYVYVVEGISDEDKLKKLGVEYIIKTGGKFIREDILLFLKEVYQKRNIILLTDPDGPGKNIASYVQKIIGKCIYIEANKKKAIKNGKVGIAEMRLDDIENLIHEYLQHDKEIEEVTISNEDMIDLKLIGPNGKENRMALILKYHIPYTSSKNVLDAINMLYLSKEEIKEVIENE